MNSADPKKPGASEETKKKFREALDRKNKQARAGSEHLDGQSSIHGTHGKADTQQQFRRKSGG